MFNNGVQVKRAGQFKKKSLLVALNRVRKCPKELTNSVEDDDDLTEGGLDVEQLETVSDELETASDEQEAVSDGESRELEDPSGEQECVTDTWAKRLRSRRACGAAVLKMGICDKH